MLGRDLDTRIGQTILAMQSSKAVGERGNVCKFLLRRKRALEKTKIASASWTAAR